MQRNTYEFVFPVRYSKYQYNSDHVFNDKEKIDALTEYFRGLPQMLRLYVGKKIPTSKTILDFLSDLKCLKVTTVVKTRMKTVMKIASKLETLSI